VLTDSIPGMAADIDPNADPTATARCPECAALVLVRDADAHEDWHDLVDRRLEQLETAPAPAAAAPAAAGLALADWPVQHDEQTGGL
jgi:hypothetical protein